MGERWWDQGVSRGRGGVRRGRGSGWGGVGWGSGGGRDVEGVGGVGLCIVG